MNNNLETLLIVFAVIAAVGLILAFVLPFLNRRGVDVPAILEQAKDLVNTGSQVFDTVKPFLPESVGLGTFDKILGAVHVGVGQAEQLYNIGELPKEERKAAAREYIIDTLNLMNVEVSPEVERVIDGAIEAEVLGLKSHDNFLTVEEIVELEKKLNDASDNT